MRTLRSIAAALVLALALVITQIVGAMPAQAAAIQHIIPAGCAPTGNVPCAFSVGSPTHEITVGPTTSGSGQVAIEAVQSPTEVYTEAVDVMREATPGQSKAWISFRHHDAKDKYVLLLKNRTQLQFIVELHGKNTTLASVPYAVALNEDLMVEIDASGFTFAVYDLRNGGRVLLFAVTDTIGRIPAGNGDSLDLYVNQGTQACWDSLTGSPQ